ncbi:MAG: hypothetical protein LBH32_03395 [Dysgonamonadaceae bacterium]|nr:hypothetical protein [Dysgonamonadaceae bacterium]
MSIAGARCLGASRSFAHSGKFGAFALTAGNATLACGYENQALWAIRQGVQNSGLKSRTFITAGERSVACGFCPSQTPA